MRRSRTGATSNRRPPRRGLGDVLTATEAMLPGKDSSGNCYLCPSTTIMLSPLAEAHEYTRSTVNPEGMELIDCPPYELRFLITWVVTLTPRTVTWVMTAPRSGVAA